MAFRLSLASKRVPRVTDARWNFSEEQAQQDEAQQTAQEYAETPSLTNGATQDFDAPQKLSLLDSAGGFMSKPGMGMAVEKAGGMVGKTVDPEGSGMGPAISGAASGAAMGTMVFPGIGTAVGAAIGLGLGLISAGKKRKQIQDAADAQAKSIMAQGMQNAAEATKQGMVKQSFVETRRLKL